LVPYAGISKETFKKFNSYTKCVGPDQDPVEIGFPYGNDVYQVRFLYDKLDRNGKIQKYTSRGITSDAKLFGQDVFDAGSSKAVTVCEGAKDACSVYEINGDFPVVAVRGASTAKAECQRQFEYLNSFEKIVLCFDNDAAGENAQKQVASLFELNKVFIVHLDSRNDVNEYLQAGEQETFKRLWWNAKRHLPDGITSDFGDIRELLDSEEDKPAVAYPWKTLQEMTYGIRTGELVLLTAQEGIGKTEVIRAIEHKILQDTEEDVNIAIIHLEEPATHTIRRFAGMSVGSPVHLPDNNLTNTEVVEHYKRVVKKNNRVHIYSHYGSDDPDVIKQAIRFLVASCGCRYVFLDHITKIVTGMDSSSDERRVLDKLMTNFDMMTKELDFSLILVSHINDEGLTRGSRNISKEALIHIRLDRDLEHPNPKIRNTTSLMLKKNRFGANTGPAGKLLWDQRTWTLDELDEVDEALPGLD
jgi:twinkle protein